MSARAGHLMASRHPKASRGKSTAPWTRRTGWRHLPKVLKDKGPEPALPGHLHTRSGCGWNQRLQKGCPGELHLEALTEAITRTAASARRKTDRSTTCRGRGTQQWAPQIQGHAAAAVSCTLSCSRLLLYWPRVPGRRAARTGRAQAARGRSLRLGSPDSDPAGSGGERASGCGQRAAPDTDTSLRGRQGSPEGPHRWGQAGVAWTLPRGREGRVLPGPVPGRAQESALLEAESC